MNATAKTANATTIATMAGGVESLQSVIMAVAYHGSERLSID